VSKVLLVDHEPQILRAVTRVLEAAPRRIAQQAQTETDARDRPARDATLAHDRKGHVHVGDVR